MNKHHQYLANKTDKLIGYYKEFYVGNKYMGKVTCEKDREIVGYAGKKSHVADTNIVLGRKTIRKGEHYTTIIYPLSV